MCRPYVCVALLALGSPVALYAQESLGSVVQGLRPGQMIRVKTVQAGRVEARLLTLDGNTLRVQRENSPDIPVANIDSLWVQGHATGTGAIVGGLAGGLVFGVLIAGACAHGADCSGVEVPAMTAGGVVVGALVGALLGSGVPRWKLRYPRRGPAVGLQWIRGRPLALALTYTF